VRPDLQTYFSPSKLNLRMMVFPFRNFSHQIGEVESRSEIFEAILPLQVMFIDDDPPPPAIVGRTPRVPCLSRGACPTHTGCSLCLPSSCSLERVKCLSSRSKRCIVGIATEPN
jgi:hypothetical protein